jgi:CDP-4-dehydro-6-deoxyglucose reductase, E1
LFMTDGYNFRNHEVCAVLGLSQLKRLDRNIDIRRSNYRRFHTGLVHIVGYKIPYYQKGNSSFSFPIIAYDESTTKVLKKVLTKNEIEYRPIISGNLLRHPAFQQYKLCTQKENPNVETLHKNGLYVGNSQFVTDKKVDRLLQILEQVSS